MPVWATKLFATGFYTGYAPVAGTVGSIPPWLLAWFVLGRDPVWMAVACLPMFFISVYFASYAEDIYGHDAKAIVIDEWAGMFLTLALVPHTLTAYGIGFVAFRICDVIKLPPAAQAEKLPRGWGITMDDAVAGLQANLLTHLVLFLVNRL